MWKLLFSSGSDMNDTGAEWAESNQKQFLFISFSLQTCAPEEPGEVEQWTLTTGSSALIPWLLANLSHASYLEPRDDSFIFNLGFSSCASPEHSCHSGKWNYDEGRAEKVSWSRSFSAGVAQTKSYLSFLKIKQQDERKKAHSKQTSSPIPGNI